MYSSHLKNLTIDIASQNFKDLRPILAEYKESAKEHNLTIAQEFSRREMLARQVYHFKMVLMNRHFKKQLHHRLLLQDLLYRDSLE